MLKKLKRLNTTKTCYPIAVEIRCIRFNNPGGPSQGQRLQVVFMKKGIVKSSTKVHEILKGPQIVMNESLAVKATLYKDSNGVLQDKQIELIIRDVTATEVGKMEVKINIQTAGIVSIPVIGSGSKVIGSTELSITIGSPSALGDDDESVIGDSEYGSVNGDPVTPSSSRVRSVNNFSDYSECETLRVRLEKALADAEKYSSLFDEAQIEILNLRREVSASKFRDSNVKECNDEKVDSSQLIELQNQLEAEEKKFSAITLQFQKEKDALDFNQQRLTFDKLKLTSQINAANEQIKELEQANAKLIQELNSRESSLSAAGECCRPVEDGMENPAKNIRIFHSLLDEERKKNNALKTILLKFTRHFTSQDNEFLFDAGIILVCNC